MVKEVLQIHKCEKGTIYNSRFIRRQDMIDYMDFTIELIMNMPLD